MTISAGTKLGRYEIRAKIGEGGMGEVYLAQDTKLDRKVALKILPAEVAAHQDRMRRFVREARAASALNHPNIITIHEIDQTDSVRFICLTPRKCSSSQSQCSLAVEFLPFLKKPGRARVKSDRMRRLLGIERP